MITFLGLMAFFFSTDNASGQQLIYDVVKGDKVIGQLRSNRHGGPEQVAYLMESTVTFRVIFEVQVDYFLECSFKDGKLVKSVTRNLVNDDVRNQSQVFWNGSQYKVVCDDDTRMLDHPGIRHNMASIYYEEPQHITQVFSERYGEFLPLRNVRAGLYEMTLPDGQVNLYQYEDGVCTEVTVQNRLATIYFRLRERL
ncbi:DUF6134 family protein [Catalinimonas alkaloidigena]|nr:DUF6134 family protein [Catalinimonas alkaloidigena]